MTGFHSSGQRIFSDFLFLPVSLPPACWKEMKLLSKKRWSCQIGTQRTVPSHVHSREKIYEFPQLVLSLMTIHFWNLSRCWFHLSQVEDNKNKRRSTVLIWSVHRLWGGSYRIRKHSTFTGYSHSSGWSIWRVLSLHSVLPFLWLTLAF